MLKNADEVFDYLGSFVNFERNQKQKIRDYRLDRMRMLLSHFGDPHLSLRTIHIAGSKGKGSTGIFLARGLAALGEKPGLYCSPHIADYRERITLAGDFFEDFLILEEGRRIIDKLPDFTPRNLKGDAEPTAFELLTLLAFLVFRAAGCSIAVIETGIGGRLDATNVVEPIATVITPVELEHTYLLGDTIPKIAAEKAGIIKAGIPVFTAEQRFPEALEVIREHAQAHGAPFYYLPEVLEEKKAKVTPQGTELSLKWTSSFSGAESPEGEAPSGLETRLSMLGLVQGDNASLALSVLRKLFTKTISRLPRERWIQTIDEVSRATLPARMELLGKEPPVVIDGAHTPVSIRHLLDTFREVFGKEGICIFGSVEGKNPEAMAALITAELRDIAISTPGSFKPSQPKEVWQTFRSYNPDTVFHPSPAGALDWAVKLAGGKRPILVTGSFYMAAEIRAIMISRKKIKPEAQ